MAKICQIVTNMYLEERMVEVSDSADGNDKDDDDDDIDDDDDDDET